MIIALAGRRMDAADATEPRFPPQNVDEVRTRIYDTLQQTGATALVSSAACGADLLALTEAGKLGLRRRIVLPFERPRFRTTSVTDRPGDWGSVYDQVLDEVEEDGDLVILKNLPDDEAYSIVNGAILNEAVALGDAGREEVSAVLVWDGVSRGDDDLTEHFGAEARKRGLAVIHDG